MNNENPAGFPNYFGHWPWVLASPALVLVRLYDGNESFVSKGRTSSLTEIQTDEPPATFI